MSPNKGTKINQLMSIAPKGAVLLSSWLTKHGYSFDLIKRYKHSGWLEPIGTGALKRAGDGVDVYGALYALQVQKNFKVHIGGRSAFSMSGKAHYLELDAKKIVLFGDRNAYLPSWFINHDWDLKIAYHTSDFLPPDLGVEEIPVKEFTVKVSNSARALMECLYLAPDKQDLTECYELMEGMNNLRPNKIQELLESCTSVKVKRLFLYLAEAHDHEWFKYLDLTKIDLGSGKRSIVKDGILSKKYQITVPKKWSSND